jgi:LysM domain
MLETLTPEMTRETTTRPYGAVAQHRVVVHRPGQPRPVLAVARPAAPHMLPPSERAVAAPVPPSRLRLTRRGRLTFLITVIALLFIAFSVGRVMSNASTSSPKPATHTVVVAPGDTAWSIAKAAMPHKDPRDAVDRLLSLNHSNGDIQVGQTLVVPGS